MAWGDPQTPMEEFVRAALMPASMVYGAGLLVHVSAYANGLLKRNKLDVPVISIGNVTVGGTGKTPITIDLTSRLAAHGLRVGVLSRGYGRRSQEETVVVCDGAGKFAAPIDAGDEPLLIARSNPNAVVITGKNRAKNGKLAIEKFGCDVLILDDGFQHFKLKRDIDIVLVDYNDNFENDNLLPAGRLREPVVALSRASKVIITKVPQIMDHRDHKRLDRMRDYIKQRAPHAAISTCRFIPKVLRPGAAYSSIVLGAEGNGFNRDLDISKLRATRVAAFCGLARPESFKATLQNLGADIVAFRTFGDHHWFTAQDIKKLKADAKDAELLISTEKDLVRQIHMVLPTDLLKRTYALKLETEWIDNAPDAAFMKLLKQASPECTDSDLEKNV